MKNVVIFEDGKLLRGSRAKLIKRGNKRVLIEFIDYDHCTGEEKVFTEWFKVFNPSWSKSSLHKRNNKRKFADYYHASTNQFYSDYDQTEERKLCMKEWFNGDYYNELFKGDD